MNVQEGFLITHTIENVRLPEPQFMKQFVGCPKERIINLFDVNDPLIPECQRQGHTDITTAAAMLGFALRMVLDVALKGLRLEPKLKDS